MVGVKGSIFFAFEFHGLKSEGCPVWFDGDVFFGEEDDLCGSCSGEPVDDDPASSLESVGVVVDGCHFFFADDVGLVYEGIIRHNSS